MKSFIAVLTLTSLFIIFGSSDLIACHLGGTQAYGMKGHSSYKVGQNYRNRSKRDSAFGYTIEPTTGTSNLVGSSIYATSDSTATTTDCNWRTANIEKFFNESYEQISEESAVGNGSHLEALASQVGCNVQQAVLLERAMQRNYPDIFAKNDVNHSLTEFYTVVNSDDQLAACWPKS